MKSDLFKIFGGLILVTVLAWSSFASLQPNKVQVKAQSTSNNASLDKAQIGLSLEKYGLKWTPDGHISYISLANGERRYFIGANQKAYVIIAKNNMSLEQAIKSKPVIKPVFGPDPSSSYRNNYATIAQVLQLDNSNPNHLFAFSQNEQQALKSDGTYDYATFTSSIGLLESYDGGLSWTDFGPVIVGDDYIAPGTKISGAGEPSAIVKDGYVYIYFADWSANGLHPDQIYLARSQIMQNNGLGAFEFWASSGFSTSQSNLVPVITLPFPEASYATLPSVSFNNALNQYFMVYEVNTGFMSSVSGDGISWYNHKMIFSFPQPQSERETGDTWYSYPSFLSDGRQATDQITEKTGNLYFSEGVWPNTAHQPTVRRLDVM